MLCVEIEDVDQFIRSWIYCVRMQMVGPILQEEAEPLPADLNTFLDKAMSSGLGAVYVSMGTLAVLSGDEVRSMAAALSALKNPVLWKLDRALLPGLLFDSVMCHYRTWCCSYCCVLQNVFWIQGMS